MKDNKLLLKLAIIATIIFGYFSANTLYERHRINEIYKWDRLSRVKDKAKRKLIEWRDIKSKSFLEKCQYACCFYIYPPKKDPCENETDSTGRLLCVLYLYDKYKWACAIGKDESVKQCQDYCISIDIKSYVYTTLFLISIIFTISVIYRLKKSNSDLNSEGRGEEISHTDTNE